MAQAGGACTAYRCHIKRGKVVVQPTTTLRTRCSVPSWAIDAMLVGYPVTVAGSDMLELYAALQARGVQVAGRLTYIDMLRYQATALRLRMLGTWRKFTRAKRRS